MTGEHRKKVTEVHPGTRVVFLGTGDAFASGGRGQSSYLIEVGRAALLVECGPTTLSALKRYERSPSDVQAVVISHFHGDHFGGLAFFYLEWLYQAPPRQRVWIAGPEGIQDKAEALYKLLYGSGRTDEIQSHVHYMELEPDKEINLGRFQVLPFCVPHQMNTVSLGFKIQAGGKTILYSGDSPWTEALALHSSDTDLFICECTHDRAGKPGHMSLEELTRNRGQLASRRVVLSHIGADVLARGSAVPFECAQDGMVLELDG
jgi:ribonuclease BN (tRNA processing enzyme)